MRGLHVFFYRLVTTITTATVTQAGHHLTVRKREMVAVLTVAL